MQALRPCSPNHITTMERLKSRARKTFRGAAQRQPRHMSVVPVSAFSPLPPAEDGPSRSRIPATLPGVHPQSQAAVSHLSLLLLPRSSRCGPRGTGPRGHASRPLYLDPQAATKHFSLRFALCVPSFAARGARTLEVTHPGHSTWGPPAGSQRRMLTVTHVYSKNIVHVVLHTKRTPLRQLWARLFWHDAVPLGLQFRKPNRKGSYAIVQLSLFSTPLSPKTCLANPS